MAKSAGGKKPLSDRDAERDDAPIHRLRLWQIQAVRDLLMLAAIIGVVWLGYAMRAVTVPLLVALLLAYLFEPLVARMTSKGRMTRPGAVGILLLTVGSSVVVLLAILVPLLVGQTIDLVRDFRAGKLQRTALFFKSYVPADYQEDYGRVVEFLGDPFRLRHDLEDHADSWSIEDTAPVKSGEAERMESGEEAESDEPSLDPAVQEETGARLEPAAKQVDVGTGGKSTAAPDEEVERVRGIIREELARQQAEREIAGTRGGAQWLNMARGGAQAVFSILGTVLQIGFVAFLIPFYFFFFSVWYPDILAFIRTLVPESRRERVYELANKMDSVVAAFVRGRIVVSLIMGAMFAVGWMLCGVPYSIVLGLVVGIFSAVPYLGGVGLPVAILLLLVRQVGLPEGERMAWWAIFLWPTVVFAIVQILESYWITPVVQGKATNLDPVTILVAVIAGGSIMGVYGMLISIPVAACLKIVLREVLLPRINKWVRGEAKDPLPIGEQ